MRPWLTAVVILLVCLTSTRDGGPFARALASPGGAGAEAGRDEASRRVAAQTADAEGIQAFREVASVLVSPRCVNCHVPGDAPLQGDDGRRHTMRVMRGSDGRGAPALRCQACHPTKNTPIAHGPPGVDGWRLPPPKTPMAWYGLSLASLCRDLKDPVKNGGRTLPQLVRHVTEDHLVQWAWDPGPNRATPPLSHEAFVAAFTRWVGHDAPCPIDRPSEPPVDRQGDRQGGGIGDRSDDRQADRREAR